MILGLPPAGRAAATPVSFYDGFETNRGWLAFEEIVGGNPCYGGGIGLVERTGEVALAGSYSLKVAANHARSRFSNHLIAHKPVADSPVSGVARMVVWARQEPAAPGSLGETGPEISIQSTKATSRPESPHITTVAGIQYLANPHDRPGTWRIWRDVGGTPTWVDLELREPIQRGVWYQLVLEADFATGQYLRFAISGAGVSRTFAVYGIPLGAENKGFSTEATELTLESENAWTNCGAAPPTTFTVNYDELVFSAA